MRWDCGTAKGRTALALIALGALLLAACNGSGKTYVSDESSGTFFTVPGDWTVYQADAMAQPRQEAVESVGGEESAQGPAGTRRRA